MAILKLALAADRKRFKELVEEYISGALMEYAKAQVAEANNYLDYIDHWQKEINRLVEEQLFLLVGQKPIKGFSDRAVAVKEVIAEYGPLEEYKRAIQAAKQVLARKYFHNSKRFTDFKDPDVEAGWNAFWLEVTSSVNDALEQRGEPLLPV